MPEVCPGGVISLQYADDTLLFLEKNWIRQGILNGSWPVLNSFLG